MMMSVCLMSPMRAFRRQADGAQAVHAAPVDRGDPHPETRLLRSRREASSRASRRNERPRSVRSRSTHNRLPEGRPLRRAPCRRLCRRIALGAARPARLRTLGFLAMSILFPVRLQRLPQADMGADRIQDERDPRDTRHREGTNQHLAAMQAARAGPCRPDRPPGYRASNARARHRQCGSAATDRASRYPAG